MVRKSYKSTEIDIRVADNKLPIGVANKSTKQLEGYYGLKWLSVDYQERPKKPTYHSGLDFAANEV